MIISNKNKISSQILCSFLALIFLSCEELGVDPDNPFEAPQEDQNPEIIDFYYNIDGSTINFHWEGNEYALEFSYKLTVLSYDNPAQQPYFEWSHWTTNTETIFAMEDLDEGQYTIHLKSRIGEVEQPAPNSLNFEIDNIQSSALRIYPINQFVREGDSFEIFVFAENIHNRDIAGSQITLHFNTSLIEYNDVDNCGTHNDIFCPRLADGSLTLVNWNINGDFGENMPLAHLSFTKLGNDSEEIIIYDGETILRNSSNEKINIDSFVNGRVHATE